MEQGGSTTTAGDREHVKPAHSVLADERYARALLAEAVPQIASGAWRLVSWELQDLRGGRRKPVALYGITYVNGTGGPVAADVVAKVFRAKRHRAAIAHTASTSLWEDGFRPPSPLRVPRPYGYAPRLSAVVSETGQGTPWADFLHEGGAALEAASARAAAWLVRLQRARVTPPQPDDDPQERTARFVRELARDHPGHRERLERLHERLAPRLAEPGRPPVPSHGDFHPKNLLITPEAVTAIDLDGFAAREPAADAGWAMGQLLLMSHFRLGDSRRGAQAAAAFWRAYADGGAADWRRTATHVARTYVEVLHYVLCALSTGKVELLDAWPDVVDAWLDSEGPDVLDQVHGRTT